MKRWCWMAIFVCAAVASSCEEEQEPCEYGPVEQLSLTVSLTPGLPGAKNCTNAPVEVKLLWDGGGYDSLTTSDGSNPPRACMEALGLTDGARVQINIEQLTSGQCEFHIITLPGGDITACDAVCHEAPTCPASAPAQGSFCSGSLSCYYGDHVDCPPDQGYVYNYDCVGGMWIVHEEGHCPACTPNCDPPPPPPPPCIEYCADAFLEAPLPPAQMTFCNDMSAMLYVDLWKCMCIVDNPCEPVCNTAPAGDVSFCDGGQLTMECQDCLMTASPAGCSDVLNACFSDI